MVGLVVLVSEVSAGFGRLSANAIAQGGHTVYAALAGSAGGRSAEARAIRAYAKRQGVDLRAIAIDIASQHSVDRAVAAILARHGRIDVVVHSTFGMTFGPAEAFTPEQFAHLFDITVLSTQRVNRAVLPHMRNRRCELVIWLSSSCSAGGTPPYMAPFVAARAALDALAAHYDRELVRWGIETAIVVPGLFGSSVDDPSKAIAPADLARAAAYESGPTMDLAGKVRAGLARIVPPRADPASVAGAVAALVDAPSGERPFRVHVDPVGDGASVAFGVIDRIRGEMLDRMELSDLSRSRTV